MSKDNFLGEIINNYDDHIRNIIYKLQKYSDILLKELSTSNNAEDNFNFNNRLIGFMICESDNILKNKIFSTGLDIKFTVTEKYLNLIKKITESDSDFYIPSTLYEYFIDMYNNINWKNRYYQNYSVENVKKDERMYDFNSILEKYLSEYEFEANKHEYMIYDKYTLAKSIKRCFEVFISTIDTLLNLMVLSPTSYRSAVLMNDMIKCMVITYICVSKIQQK
jgi:hypothetical protein